MAGTIVRRSSTPSTAPVQKPLPQSTTKLTQSNVQGQDTEASSPSLRTNTSSPAVSAPAKSHRSAFAPSSLNAFAVNTLTAQAHRSRPAPNIKAGTLHPKYKSVARRVTLVMVAAPIAIVTSWVLWERIVMGQERKKLGKPSKPAEEGA